MNSLDSFPLVSIGIPTCNRVALLNRALQSLLAQDYPNIEIIVSDNASSDETSVVCRKWSELKPDIVKYHHNDVNIGMIKNFEQTLIKAKGEYFMWASDDDLWEPAFISSLMPIFLESKGLILVAAEAQYRLGDGTLLPFFSEGKCFYQGQKGYSLLKRLLTMCYCNYGNLWYGIYRRQNLVYNDTGTILSGMGYFNENPLFIRIAALGEIRVYDQILMYKTTNLATYFQAAWEYGYLPNVAGPDLADTARSEPLNPSVHWTRGFISETISTVSYHVSTFLDVKNAIVEINVNPLSKGITLMAYFIRLSGHFVRLFFLNLGKASSGTRGRK